MVKRVVSISGGKDSVAMLVMLLEKNINVDYIVYINTGIEFPQVVNFVRSTLNEWVSKNFGVEVTELHPPLAFSELTKRYGVPGLPRRMWCQRLLKRDAFYSFLLEEKIKEVELYVGYNYNEIKRYEHARIETVKYARRYNIEVKRLNAILISERITEKGAFKLCREHDLLNTIYKIGYKRTGCFLCPAQSICEWRILYNKFRPLFTVAKIIEKESIKEHKKSFRTDYTLEQLQKRFESENAQKKITEYLQ